MFQILAFFSKFAKIELMKKLIFLLTATLFTLPTFAAGTLEISVSSYSGVVPKNGIRIPFLTIHATAKNEPVQISEVRVQRNGLSQDNDIARIIAITDDYRRSLNSGINEGIATLRFRKPLTIGVGETTDIIVYGNLQITAASGRTIGLQLEGIESDAVEVIPIERSQTPIITKPQTKPMFKVVCRNRKCVRVRR